MDLLTILVSAGSITYSVVFGIIAKKVIDVPKTVDHHLKVHEDRFLATLDRIEKENQIAHRRLNVHDRLTSKVINREIDSRTIAEHGNYPEIRVRHADFS